ncbi:hypothetical protein AAF712_012015 [Marasmius tenuissimus]|uniref:Uncharacterized protein n=1 Tax=Marasmius tenuissimus TaxID=585030 RepID=A0ABR2ZIM4_9AGAR
MKLPGALRQRVNRWQNEWTIQLCNHQDGDQRHSATDDMRSWIATHTHFSVEWINGFADVDLVPKFLCMMGNFEHENTKQALDDLINLQVFLAQQYGQKQRSIINESACNHYDGLSSDSDADFDKDLSSEDLDEDNSESLPMNVDGNSDHPLIPPEFDRHWSKTFDTWNTTFRTTLVAWWPMEDGEVYDWQEQLGEIKEIKEDEVTEVGEDIYGEDFDARQQAFLLALRPLKAVSKSEYQNARFRPLFIRSGLCKTMADITRPDFLAKHFHPHVLKLERLYSFVRVLGFKYDQWVFGDAKKASKAAALETCVSALFDDRMDDSDGSDDTWQESSSDRSMKDEEYESDEASNCCFMESATELCRSGSKGYRATIEDVTIPMEEDKRGAPPLPLEGPILELSDEYQMDVDMDVDTHNTHDTHDMPGGPSQPSNGRRKSKPRKSKRTKSKPMVMPRLSTFLYLI